MNDKPGVFLQGCGVCPSELLVRNLKVFEWHPPGTDEQVAACPQVAGHGTLLEKDPVSVAQELGWCRCGSNDRVDELMLAYLGWLEQHWVELKKLPFPSPPAAYAELSKCPLPEDTQILLMYLADELGWTEHGGSVYGAWLTDGGEEAFTNLRSR